jgi:hypothetical protein
LHLAVEVDAVFHDGSSEMARVELSGLLAAAPG